MRHFTLCWSLTVCLLLLANANAADLGYTLELTDKELQRTVELYFPLIQEAPFSKLTLTSPAVRLDPKTNRIGLAVSVAIALQDIAVGKGRGLIDGTLEYRPDTGEFYLRDPQLKQVKLYQVQTEYNTLVQNFLNGLTRQTFPVIVVYRLQDDDLRQRMLKSSLKSVTVRGGKLIVKMGLP